nr:hypothetical protein [Tanacetum cinerariifolium]
FLHHSSANSWQWDLHSSGSGNTLHWQWELILPVGTLSWQWECLVHFIPNTEDVVDNFKRSQQCKLKVTNLRDFTSFSSLVYQTKVLHSLSSFRQELLGYTCVHDNDASESSKPSWGKMCTSGTVKHCMSINGDSLNHDMHTIGMTMQQVQLNTKFLNALPLEWSKFVIDVKLAKREGYMAKIVHLAKEAETFYVVQREVDTIPQNSAFQTKDLDAYNSDCDDISWAKADLMANPSCCD